MTRLIQFKNDTDRKGEGAKGAVLPYDTGAPFHPKYRGILMVIINKSKWTLLLLEKIIAQ